MKRKGTTSTGGILFALFAGFWAIMWVMGLMSGMKEEREAEKLRKQNEPYWNKVAQITPGDGHTGGTDFICYDRDAEEFTNRYSHPYQDVFTEAEADNIGAILYYSSEFREETGQYMSYQKNKIEEVKWELETLHVQLTDRRTGRKIAQTKFTVELPQRFGSDAERKHWVDESDVRQWVRDSWSAYSG